MPAKLLPAWAEYIHHDSSETYLSDISPRIGDSIEKNLNTVQQASTNQPR